MAHSTAATQQSVLTAATADEGCEPAKQQAVLEQFYRDGFVRIPGVLSPEECARARALIDAVFDDPTARETHHVYSDIVAVRLFERDRFFRDLLLREPIISLAEAVLGSECHLMAQNAVRNPPGRAIDRFHVDGEVEFPVADEMARHDPRLRMPVFRMTMQIPLTDIPTLAHGPSEYIPGSHYSGRHPNNPTCPMFEGRGAVAVLSKAGDMYLHNGQCWHRGAPNTTQTTRYLLQLGYCQRWVAQRFFPFLNYRMPDQVLEGADERLLRVLGKHPKGAYG